MKPQIPPFRLKPAFLPVVQFNIHMYAAVQDSHCFSTYNLQSSLKFCCLVESLVPLLALLKDHGANNGANHDSQQGAQQKQEDLPASEGCASEISRRIINIVCFGGKDVNMIIKQLNEKSFCQKFEYVSCVTFRRLEETDTRLDLRPVLVVLLRSVFYHQLVHLHRDDVMIICTEETVSVRSSKRHQDYCGHLREIY